MGYLNFDKDKLVNLSYSLERETLRTNREVPIHPRHWPDAIHENTMAFWLSGWMSWMEGNMYCSQHSMKQSFSTKRSLTWGSTNSRAISTNPKVTSTSGILSLIPFKAYIQGRRVILTRTRLLVEHENTLLVKYTLEEANSRQNFGSNHSWPSGMSILSAKRIFMPIQSTHR